MLIENVHQVYSFGNKDVAVYDGIIRKTFLFFFVFSLNWGRNFERTNHSVFFVVLQIKGSIFIMTLFIFIINYTDLSSYLNNSQLF